jgi:type I site-specific restriction endonuclease
MPKRNRANEKRKQFGTAAVVPVVTAAKADAAPAVVAKPVDEAATRAAKMFAESLSAHEAADQAERERVRLETEQMQRHETLKANKQRAADLIKQLRGQDRARQRRVEAEAAYRVALAELQEFETGERPAWAPAVEVEDDIESDSHDSSESADDNSIGDDSASTSE